MIKAVIDTNVLVSAFWTPNRRSPTVRIADAITKDLFTPLYSPQMIVEYREVLSRSKFAFSEDEVHNLVDHIVTHGELVEPTDSADHFPDPDDKVFFCTVLAASADNPFLVTGNAKHYPPADFIVSPAEFCDILGI
ncbi:MAG: putative toxin-antitoxin system toxin component, PIN family [Kiritimatiellae bacterium]|jgi:putative PIN family toxin of toxin-antitoxin system|nr:putative toxin-antitoxin system toxin component, PIN family [Kiritimatiellia bacterium]